MPFPVARQRIGAAALLLAGLLLSALIDPAADAQSSRVSVTAATARATVPAGLDGTPLRVLLRQAGSLEITAVAGALQLSDGRGRRLLLVPAWRRLRLEARSTGLVAVVEGFAGPSAPVVLPLAPLRLEPEASDRPEPTLFALGDLRYRGRLVVRPEGRGLQAINVIGVESYLPSVVGSEMPASWPLAALQAQAVAARTYALSQRRPSAAYDLKSTVASQVYRGVAAETPSTREAVAATRGQVLTYGDALIDAVFHSSSGGATENSGELWSRQLPYLVSVPDFDDRSPVRQWQRRFEPDQLRQAFPETGGVQGIEVLAKSSTGRIRRARIVGPSGALEVSGGELRQRLGLRSTLADFRWLAAGPAGVSGIEAASADASSAGGARTGGASPGPLAGVDAAPAAATSAAPAASPTGGGAIQGAIGRATSAAGVGAATPPVASLLVSGRGFGHGVGMSQWGAYALALRGQGHQQILSHYYPGARLSSWPPR
ncbi:MAG: SpoIID/LytB domain-containing protein [Cyanobacteriota bacterium]|nr:SpoIID/LytB domain-containing protein [Cyanobacteriota bacterium]